MTTSKPFWVVICSVCGKRVNGDTSHTEDDGHTVHDECCVSELALASHESLTIKKPLDRWRTLAAWMIQKVLLHANALT
jgi:hypothetical protein